MVLNIDETGNEPEIEQRRAKIADAFARGITSQRRLAGMLDVSVGTINRDLKILKAQWREEALEDVREVLGQQLIQIRAAQQDAWQAWEKSRGTRVKTVTGKNTDGKEWSRTEVTHEPGDARHLEVFLKCVAEQRKMYGLDLPENIQSVLATIRQESSPEENAIIARMIRLEHLNDPDYLDYLRKLARERSYPSVDGTVVEPSQGINGTSPGAL
jgi:Trp operon repressor